MDIVISPPVVISKRDILVAVGSFKKGDQTGLAAIVAELKTGMPNAGITTKDVAAARDEAVKDGDVAKGLYSHTLTPKGLEFLAANPLVVPPRN